jgi:RNA polymerase sigma-70 factor, ECF subfamily
MEHFDLQKGIFETPPHQQPRSEELAGDLGSHALRLVEHEQQAPNTARAVGAVALAGVAVGSIEPSGQPAAVVAEEAGRLLHRAQAGEREAFAELYRHYVGPLTRYVTRRVRDWERHAVPDIVQDAFCAALADMPNAGGEDVRGWLMAHATKAYNQHSWSWRRYTRTAYRQFDEARTAGSSASDSWAEPASAAGEPVTVHREVMAQALARLPPDHRRAVQLRYLEELPRDLTAEVLSRTPEAVRMLERRGLARLREELGQEAEAGTPVVASTHSATSQRGRADKPDN